MNVAGGSRERRVEVGRKKGQDSRSLAEAPRPILDYELVSQHCLMSTVLQNTCTISVALMSKRLSIGGKLDVLR